MSYDEQEDLCRKSWEKKFIFVVIDLKREIKEVIVFEMEAKIHKHKAPLKRYLFD